jgi:homoserine kinase type II
MRTSGHETPPELPASVEAALAIAQRYGVRQIAAIGQFESFGNENWLLETPDGRRLVLRRYIHSNLGRVQFQLRWQQHLRRRGFPAAEVLASHSGGASELDGEGVAWAAFAHIKGREYDFSLSDAVQAGRRLAEFHAAGQTFGEPAPPLPHRPPLRECWLNADADLAGLKELFAGADVDDDLAYLEGWWTFVKQEWPVERLDALPAGLVHGDFHGRNTAYVNGRLAGIFDFDDVEHAPLLQDVANATYKFGRESRFSLMLRPDVVHAFRNAYEEVRPLTPEERAALPLMLAMTYPPNPRYYAFYRDHHGSNLENRLRREVRTMRALREQAATLFPH